MLMAMPVIDKSDIPGAPKDERDPSFMPKIIAPFQALPTDVFTSFQIFLRPKKCVECSPLGLIH